MRCHDGYNAFRARKGLRLPKERKPDPGRWSQLSTIPVENPIREYFLKKSQYHPFPACKIAGFRQPVSGPAPSVRGPAFPRTGAGYGGFPGGGVFHDGESCPGSRRDRPGPVGGRAAAINQRFVRLKIDLLLKSLDPRSRGLCLCSSPAAVAAPQSGNHSIDFRELRKKCNDSLSQCAPDPGRGTGGARGGLHFLKQGFLQGKKLKSRDRFFRSNRGTKLNRKSILDFSGTIFDRDRDCG